jgi:hypothetical protein
VAPPRPCPACPWRAANQGRRHPGHWYTQANLRRLWAGLRSGEDMSCHPTDPGNPVPEGMKGAPRGARVLECAGAHILRQREFMRFQHILLREAHDDLSTGLRLYRERHPRGLTKAGIMAIVARHVFGSVPLLGSGVLPHPDLREPGITGPGLVPWTEKDEKELFGDSPA